jgi:hypothetical protein
VTAEIRIPIGWSIDSVLVCAPGQVQWTPTSNGAQMEATYDPPLVLLPFSGVPLLVRVLVQAPTPGKLYFENSEAHGGTPEYSIGWVDSDATAGVSDCFCFRSCEDGQSACSGWFSPSTLALEILAPNRVAADTFRVGHYRREGGYVYTCPVAFATNAPWLSVTSESVGYGRTRLTVTADASSLPPGDYEAQVICISACRTCATVRLCVLTCPPPAVEGTSWGRVKHRWR